MIRGILQTLLYPIALMNGGDLEATVGSPWHRFLAWVYGHPGEIQHDGWIWPDTDDSEK